ncbi:MAG: YkgJ family cysteine cluster protein [Ginsengibacter sp.]
MDMANEINNESTKITQVERQLEHSSYYNQTVLSQYANRINEVESFLFGLIDLLTEKKTINTEELQLYISKIKDEVKEKGEALHAGIALRIDRESENENSFIPVNCNERIHICNAVCCKLNFALSPGEVDSGKIKWDLGRPYFIRHEKNGYCTHFDENKKCCSIYDNRPKVCSAYSCANDERIWTDFENMILNTEWIEANLNGHEPKMFLMDIHQKL